MGRPHPMTWPSTPEELAAEQERLAACFVEPWTPPSGALRARWPEPMRRARRLARELRDKETAHGER